VEEVCVARHRQLLARVPTARLHRRAVAGGTPHPWGACAQRVRPRPAPRVAARAPRQARPPPRGRHGRVG